MCAIHWLARHVYMPEKQRPWAGATPPGAVYRFAPNWKEEHVLSHLAHARGILQADGYKGYAKLYAPEPGGVPRLREAACWAHLRRGNLGTCDDHHRDRQTQQPRPASLSRRHPRPYPRPQNQQARRIAAVELGAAGRCPSRGCLMAAVTHVCIIDYVDDAAIVTRIKALSPR